MARQLKRSAPVECDSDRPAKIIRTAATVPKAPAKGRKLKTQTNGMSPSKSGSFDNKDKPESQKAKTGNVFTDSATSFAHPLQANSEGSNASLGAGKNGSPTNPIQVHDDDSSDNRTLPDSLKEIVNSFLNRKVASTKDKGKGKVPSKSAQPLDLTDLLPTNCTASSSAAPYIHLKTLLKNLGTTKKVLKDQDRAKPITVSPIIATIQWWEGQLWRGIQDIEDADDARVVQVTKDIEWLSEREEKHELEAIKKVAEEKGVWVAKIRETERECEAVCARRKEEWKVANAQREAEFEAKLAEAEKRHEVEMKELEGKVATEKKKNEIDVKKITEKMAAEKKGVWWWA
jgi:hypothetical protein